MEYIPRTIENDIRRIMQSGISILLLGPRQTGKTTLLKQIKSDLMLTFTDPTIRLTYEKEPQLLIKNAEALYKEKKRPIVVFLDEIQKIPILMDSVQYLIDNQIAQCMITGSSMLKIRRQEHLNLLPGRIVLFRLDPLSITEESTLSLEDRLLDGSLPGVIQQSSSEIKEEILRTYVTTYMDEEIRQEAQIRKIQAFTRFLEIAASESGGIINFRKLSNEIGVAHTTIRDYYQILEDSLLIERIQPFWKSKIRRTITRNQKYIFYDLGIRRMAAEEGRKLPRETLGKLFEQFIGLELIRLTRRKNVHVRFWRNTQGAEVDWILETDNKLIPIEVKWTNIPTEKHLGSIPLFLQEEAKAEQGFVLCRTNEPALLKKNITAIPWQQLPNILENL